MNFIAMEGLTLRQAAQELHVSVPTLRRWIRKGKLQAYLSEGQYGEEWRIPAEEIERVRRPDGLSVGVAYWKGRFEQQQQEWARWRNQFEKTDGALEQERVLRQRREAQLAQVIEHAEELQEQVRRLQIRLEESERESQPLRTTKENPVGEGWMKVVSRWLRFA